MSKTNFKCMFLIDDKLYNKAILRDGINENINIKVPTPNSYLTSIPSSRQISNAKPEGKMNAPERLKSSEEINYLDKNDNGQQVNINLSDKEQQTEIPFASASSAILAPHEKSGNTDDMDIDQSMNEKEDCECYETLPKASSSQKRQTEDVTRKSSRSCKKLTTMKPLSAQAKRNLSDEDDNLSDDSDWEELRQRYRRLRGDFDSPPQEENNFDQVSEEKKTENNIRSNENNASTLMDRKKDGPITKFESISYICSLCKEMFRKRNALHRHIMNWHAEYFEDPGSRNKRKRSNEDNKKNKKIRSDGRKKRNLPQNQTRQKIARTELPCVFCQRFFKTKYALERHNASIHSVNTGSKRANNGNEARYVKRQKGDAAPAITYLDYF